MQVRSIAVDASGQWLASGGDDGTARLWEVKQFKQTPSHTEPARNFILGSFGVVQRVE